MKYGLTYKSSDNRLIRSSKTGSIRGPGRPRIPIIRMKIAKKSLVGLTMRKIGEEEGDGEIGKTSKENS